MRRYSSRYGRYVDDTDDNAGTVSVDTSGDLSVGIGGGLGIDTANGDLTVQIAPGVSIDTGIDLF